MDQYIVNIIPRIKNFSRSLNKIESFVDRTWLLFDDNNNHTEYTFLRDNSLIKSVSGLVNTGTWRLLPTDKLLINVGGQSLLFECLFLNEGVFIINISGDRTNGYIFMNESVLQNKNIHNYLDSLGEKGTESDNLNSDFDFQALFLFFIALTFALLILFGLSSMNHK